ncbi:uncharacterized protein EI97DRAFT_460229 [Westerdykella ornata]|uniref:Uncharacterized protein n=1 Tax=Westerdykella ornata TaxID=318751 RepID=A0A6A6JCT0_WESOR|nr:uncharacterized protein EI97DRAFT_460229 [Westerdykella ornata]KAF2274371.1 hypothetical protein EI97DRAFT_460229 [Westerdykella ornata]
MSNSSLAALEEHTREWRDEIQADAALFVLNNPADPRLSREEQSSEVVEDAPSGLSDELLQPRTSELRPAGIPLVYPGWDELTDGRLYELHPYRPEYNFEKPFFTTGPNDIDEPPVSLPAQNNMLFSVHAREWMYPDHDWDILPAGVDQEVWQQFSKFGRIEVWFWVMDPEHPRESDYIGIDWILPPKGVHPYEWAMLTRYNKVEQWLAIADRNQQLHSRAAEGSLTPDVRTSELSTAGFVMAAEFAEDHIRADTISPGQGLTNCQVCCGGPPGGFICLGCQMNK